MTSAAPHRERHARRHRLWGIAPAVVCVLLQDNLRSWSKPTLVEIIPTPEEALANALDRLQGADPITASAIIKAFAAVTPFSRERFIGRGRKYPLVKIRQAAMALTRRTTNASWAAIGRKFGRHPATVIHAWKRYEAMVDRAIAARSQTEGK